MTIKNKKQVLSRADKILAVSHNTKADLVDHYNIPEERITVTYLASSLKSTNINPNNQSQQGARFFLYVGARNLYKNFPDFVKALAPLIKTRADLYLYCAGGGRFNRDELSLFAELKITNKVKIHSGSDEILKELYSSAVALFYPSLYEGFGIPLLEAMNCGCPIATSNISSLPEVGGNAALYFDPLNKEEMLGVAERLVNDNEMRLSLIQKGYERAKEFSWEKTARETYLVYKAMI
jgi:glycosyltransferase involved in cell wall biosynthesis